MIMPMLSLQTVATCSRVWNYAISTEIGRATWHSNLSLQMNDDHFPLLWNKGTDLFTRCANIPANSGLPTIKTALAAFSSDVWCKRSNTLVIINSETTHRCGWLWTSFTLNIAWGRWGSSKEVVEFFGSNSWLAVLRKVILLTLFQDAFVPRFKSTLFRVAKVTLWLCIAFDTLLPTASAFSMHPRCTEEEDEILVYFNLKLTQPTAAWWITYVVWTDDSRLLHESNWTTRQPSRVPLHVIHLILQTQLPFEWRTIQPYGDAELASLTFASINTPDVSH